MAFFFVCLALSADYIEALYQRVALGGKTNAPPPESIESLDSARRKAWEEAQQRAVQQRKKDSGVKQNPSSVYSEDTDNSEEGKQKQAAAGGAPSSTATHNSPAATRLDWIQQLQAETDALAMRRRQQEAAARAQRLAELRSLEQQDRAQQQRQQQQQEVQFQMARFAQQLRQQQEAAAATAAAGGGPRGDAPNQPQPQQRVPLEELSMEELQQQFAVALQHAQEQQGGGEERAVERQLQEPFATALLGGGGYVVPMVDPQVEADRALRAEQDLEYQQALEQDRQAAEERRQKEEAAVEQVRAEQAAAAAKQQREEERAQQLRDLKLRLRESLQEEPPAGEEGAVTVRVRLPGGAPHNRRFRGGARVQEVYDWVQQLDDMPGLGEGQWKLMSSYPRSEVGRRVELAEVAAGCRQVALLVEEGAEEGFAAE